MSSSLGLRVEFIRTPYVPGEHTAAAHLRPCAAKSDCDPAQDLFDSCYISGLDYH